MVEAVAREAAPRAGRFVGRKRELAEVRDALSDAVAGRGRLLMFTGEPGIGKTSLADEAAILAKSRGMTVAWGRCWEGGGAPAYWPWIQITRSIVAESESRPHDLNSEIARLLPELATEAHPATDRTGTEEAQFRFFDAVATMVREEACRNPLLLVLDDLHEADLSSLQMLKFVARELHDAAILIVGTYRDAEMHQSPERLKLTNETLRDGKLVPLAGLDEAQVAQMVEARAGAAASDSLVGEVHRVTAGNPLFIDGVVRVLAADGRLAVGESIDLTSLKLPDSVRGAIARRLAMLSSEARAALVVGATIGDEFHASLLTRVMSENADRLPTLIHEAEELGIVAGAGVDRWRFTHPLICEALRNEPKDAKRAELHRAIGEAIEQMHAANLKPHLSALAHHFREAGISGKGIDYSARAGRAAYAVFAFEEAFAHLQAALELMDEHGSTLELRAEVLWLLSQEPVSGKNCVDYFEASAKAFEELGDTDSMATAYGNLGLVICGPAYRNQDIARGMRYLRKAELVLGKGPPRFFQACVYIQLTPSLTWALELEEATKTASRGAEIAERLTADDFEYLSGNSRDYCRAHTASQMARLLIMRGRLAEGFELSRKAWEIADKTNTTMATTSVALSGGFDFVELWDPVEGERWFTRELANIRTARSNRRGILINEVIDSSALRGSLEEARRHLRDVGRSYAMLIGLFEGTWDETAARLAKTIDRLANAGALDAETRMTYWASRLARIRGEYLRARELIERNIEIFATRGKISGEVQARPEAVLLYFDMGEIAAASSHLRRLREIIAEGEDWRGLTGAYSRAEAVVAAAEGRLDEAQAHFQEAIETFRRYQLPWEESETLLYWGRAMDSVGDSRAGEKFDAAIELYRRHGGGQRWIDRVESERQTRARPVSSVRPKASAYSIFRREGEFWTLAANGATVRLRDAKGLRYIAYLLARPGQRIHVHDLITAVDGGAADAQSRDSARADGLEIVHDNGGPAAALDSRARSEYAARLREARAELEESTRFNDAGRSERLRAEIEVLSDELNAGFGRQAASDSAERARGMVSKRIRATLDKIGEMNPALGRYFAASIKTGYFCAYLPDPDHKIAWQL